MKETIQRSVLQCRILRQLGRAAFGCQLLIWLGAQSLCAGNLPAPSPRPSDITEEEWSRLFGGEPQVIMAHVVTGDGVSWYDICGWDPKRPEYGGMGFERAFVRVANDSVTVAWRAYPFGDHAPAWMQLGLSLAEAAAMVRQYIKKWIQINGIEETKTLNHKIYYESPPPVKLAVANQYYKYFPEVIEARKQLGLLPKDFAPPLSPEEREYVEMLARKRYLPAHR